MSWECRREGAYRYDRDVRKGPYAWWSQSMTMHRAGLPHHGTLCPVRKGVDAPGRPRWVQDSELSALPRTPHRCGEMEASSSVRLLGSHVFSTGKAVSF